MQEDGDHVHWRVAPDSSLPCSPDGLSRQEGFLRLEGFRARGVGFSCDGLRDSDRVWAVGCKFPSLRL